MRTGTSTTKLSTRKPSPLNSLRARRAALLGVERQLELGGDASPCGWRPSSSPKRSSEFAGLAGHRVVEGEEVLR